MHPLVEKHRNELKALALRRQTREHRPLCSQTPAARPKIRGVSVLSLATQRYECLHCEMA
jgi:hypothetical protein